MSPNLRSADYSVVAINVSDKGSARQVFRQMKRLSYSKACELINLSSATVALELVPRHENATSATPAAEKTRAYLDYLFDVMGLEMSEDEKQIPNKEWEIKYVRINMADRELVVKFQATDFRDGKTSPKYKFIIELPN